MQMPTFLSERSPLIASTAALVASVALSSATVVSAAFVVSVFAELPQAASMETAIADTVKTLKIFFIFSSSKIRIVLFLEDYSRHDAEKK